MTIFVSLFRVFLTQTAQYDKKQTIYVMYSFSLSLSLNDHH